MLYPLHEVARDVVELVRQLTDTEQYLRLPGHQRVRYHKRTDGVQQYHGTMGRALSIELYES